jgi:polyphosphate kinase 2 (PPK2 family)
MTENAMGYAHRVGGRGRVELKDFDPAENAGLTKEAGEEMTSRVVAELVELQELLYAARRQCVVVVLQGRDTRGQGSAHQRVFGRSTHKLRGRLVQVPTRRRAGARFPLARATRALASATA